jgi:hypothetical protein
MGGQNGRATTYDPDSGTAKCEAQKYLSALVLLVLEIDRCLHKESSVIQGSGKQRSGFLKPQWPEIDFIGQETIISLGT